LKAIRIKNNLTHEQLGKMCGKGKAAMWELEQQTAEPKLRTAYVVAKVLGVEVEEIWPNDVQIIEETIMIRRVVS
jgi:DNA-binding XRE family transcriptional regulator